MGIRSAIGKRALGVMVKRLPSSAKITVSAVALNTVQSEVKKVHKRRKELLALLKARDFSNSALRNALKLKGFVKDHKKYVDSELFHSAFAQAEALSERVLSKEYCKDDVAFLRGDCLKFIELVAREVEKEVMKRFPA